MNYRNLITIKLDHAYFNGDRKLDVQITIPGSSENLAQRYGLLLRLKDNGIYFYGRDTLNADDLKDIGPFWIHLTFPDTLYQNYTGIDYQKDKEILFTGFNADENSENYSFEVKNTIQKLLDLCSTHGISACEPDKLILPDKTIWEVSLDGFLTRLQERLIDPGFVQLEGGVAEGTYLHFINEEWSYPHATLRIDPSCFKLASEVSTPQEFTVVIPSREVYWCYYVIQRSDSALTNVSLSSEKKGEDDTISLPEFGQSESVEFQNDKKALKIVSKTSYALKERYPFIITLISQSMSGDPLKLPYPGVNLLSSIERSGKVELCSESYIYL